MIFSGDSFEEIQCALLGDLLCARESAPRGQKVRERLGVQLRLADPRARLTASPDRAANYGFAAGEFLWYLRGANDLESISYYNKRMKDFSDDGRLVHSAYGFRVGIEARLAEEEDGGKDQQWTRVVEELTRDRDSRRAVMTIFSPYDLKRALSPVGTKDVPCTLSLQFFVRDGRLDLHVTMRSNDAVWGLANDLFSFTLLQEVMLLDLRGRSDDLRELRLGEYVHTAGSMHLYERHFAMADAVYVSDHVLAKPMPALTSPDDLDRLLVAEEYIRENSARFKGELFADGTGERWLFDRLLEHRAKRDAESP